MFFIFLTIIFPIFFCLLSFRIIKIRRREKISIGSEKSEILSRYISAQKNLFEYSIIFLLQIFALEILVASRIILSILLVTFILGRILHFLSLTKFEVRSDEKKNYKLRVLGMLMTFMPIIFNSFYLGFLFI